MLLPISLICYLFSSSWSNLISLRLVVAPDTEGGRKMSRRNKEKAPRCDLENCFFDPSGQGKERVLECQLSWSDAFFIVTVTFCLLPKPSFCFDQTDRGRKESRLEKGGTWKSRASSLGLIWRELFV